MTTPDDHESWISTQLDDVDDVPRRELRTDAPWREAVRNRLKALKMNQTMLGLWVGTGQSQISQLLDDEKVIESSQFVERISRALRIPLPSLARIQIVAEEMASRNETGVILAMATALEAMSAPFMASPRTPLALVPPTPDRADDDPG